MSDQFSKFWRENDQPYPARALNRRSGICVAPSPASLPSPASHLPSPASRFLRVVMKRGALDAADGAGRRRRAPTLRAGRPRVAPCVVPALKKKMNSLVEVLLPSKYLSGEGKPVKLNQLWGTDVYSDDSDLVAVLVHTGHLKLKSSTPKTTLLVSLRVCPPPDAFVGSERNGIRSREWAKGHGGVSFKVERCLQQAAATPPTPELSMLRPSSSSRRSPARTARWSRGRAARSRCRRRVHRRSLSSEPSLKYSPLVSDQGTTCAARPPPRTRPARPPATRPPPPPAPPAARPPPPLRAHPADLSARPLPVRRPDRPKARLRREALYLESRTRRFELAHAGVADGADRYTLSQVLKPHTMGRKAMEAEGVPLPARRVKKLHEGLDWEEIVWGPCFVRVRGDEYPLVNVSFMPNTKA